MMLRRVPSSFVLTHLAAVRGLGLLDSLYQLVNLFLGGVQLAVDRCIVRRKAVVVSLEGDHLLGKVVTSQR